MSATSIGNIHIGLYVDIGDQRRFTEVANLVERDSRRMNTALGQTSRSVGLLRTQMSQNLRLKMGAESLRTLSRATDDINRMRAALMGLAAVTGTGLTGALSAAYLLQTADKARLLSNQLKTVTTSTADLNAVQEQLFAVSQRTRSSFESTTTIYARTARATETLGTSQEKLLRITETVQKAFAIGGASSQEAQGAAIQLSQGIASDRLGGEEFRSVAENAPVLLKGIADSLGVNIGKLREMAHAGELTAKVVTEAIVQASAKIDQEFGKTAATVGQGITMLDNAFLKYIGSTDEAYGVTRNLAESLKGLADNFEDVMWWITRVGGGLALLYASNAATRKGQGIAGGIQATNAGIREEMAALVEQNKEIADRRVQIAESIADAKSAVEDAENKQRFDQANTMHSAREKEYAVQQSIGGLEQKRADVLRRMQLAQADNVAKLKKEVEVGHQLVRDNAARLAQSQEAALAEERKLAAMQQQRVARASENVATKAGAVASADAAVNRTRAMMDRERSKAEYDAQVKFDEARAAKQAQIDKRRSALVEQQMKLRATQSQVSDFRGIQGTEGFDRTFGKQYRGLLAEQQKSLIGTAKLRDEIKGLEGDLESMQQKATSSRGLTAAMTQYQSAIKGAERAVADLSKATEARNKIAAAPVGGKSMDARIADEQKSLERYQKSLGTLQGRMKALADASSSAFSGKIADRLNAELEAVDKKIQAAQASLTKASAAVAASQAGDSKALAASMQAQAQAARVINDLEKESVALVQRAEVNTNRLAAAQRRLNVARRVGSNILNFFGGWTGVAITAALVAATTMMAKFAAASAESAEQTERITRQLENMGYLAAEAADGAVSLKDSLAQGKISKLQTELKDFQKEIDKTRDMLEGMDLSSTKINDNFSYPEFTGKTSRYSTDDPLQALTQYEIAREAAATEVGKKISLIRDEMVKTKTMTDSARKSLEDMALANPDLASITMTIVRMGEMMNGLNKATTDWVKTLKEAADAAKKGAPSFRELEIKSMSDLKSMNAANQPMLDEMGRANNRTEWEAKLKDETDKIIAAAEKLGNVISISAARAQAQENIAAEISKKGLKDLISHYEGTGDGTRGYNETLDRGRWTSGEVNLVQMTLKEVLAVQDKMRTPENRALYGEGKGSSAVGKYMIVGETLRGLMKELGLSGDELFDKDMQDRLADAIIRGTGGSADKLRGQWAGLNKASDFQINTASGVSMQSLPAMDESTKEWLDGMKDLNLQTQIKSLKEFDQSVLQQAQSMGISTDQMKEYIAAVQSGNLDAIPEKFQQIATAMRAGINSEFVQQFKELQNTNIIPFLSEIDQEVIDIAKSLGATSDEVNAFAQAAADGRLESVSTKFAEIRNQVELTAQNKSLVEFADGLGEAFGGMFMDAKNGEDIFGNLTDRIADLAIQMLVVQPIVENLQNTFRNMVGSMGGGGGGGLLGNLFGGLFGGGGLSGATVSKYTPLTGLFKTGGYTGSGDPSKVAGAVHNEEFVFDADATRKAGPANLAAMMQSIKGGGAAGMMQGSIPMPNFTTTSSYGKLPAPKDMASGVRGSEGIAISVAADIDRSGNIIPLVMEVAQDESRKTTSKGIADYNKTMPDRVKQINANPRKR